MRWTRPVRSDGSAAVGSTPWTPLIAMGVCGYATHYCVTRSMAAADASFVVPFDFLRLPLSVGFGYALFAERLEPWVWLGAAVIFAGAYYNTWRESRLGLNPRR